ncbi:MAG TPA: hypothetical protein VM510_11660 [Caulifigura sp.]|jgi:hypothetical protein|nr:hypothetical protein [Caulifigura sp.]
MHISPQHVPSLSGTRFVITRQGAVLFDDIALTSGPVMSWRGRQQVGHFVVESATSVPVLRGERLEISGSDGTSQSIIVAEVVDNVVYFRTDNGNTSSPLPSDFGERWSNPQRFHDGYSGRAIASVN